VIEFNNVTRSVLARQPNGVPEAAAAELAKTSVNKHAPSIATSRRAFAESMWFLPDNGPPETGHDNDSKPAIYPESTSYYPEFGLLNRANMLLKSPTCDEDIRDAPES
jgi:hypothetical protein